MSIDEKPKHKTFRVVEEYDVQSTFEVEVPIVYLEDYDYEPMAWSKEQNCYVEPDEVAQELTSKDNHCDDDWESRGTLETYEIEEI